MMCSKRDISRFEPSTTTMGRHRIRIICVSIRRAIQQANWGTLAGWIVAIVKIEYRLEF